ncbi:MAG: hypothetical protein HYS21_13700 [Deltaproteobacteria bacterium]|nr:hypothetical protein [Deltaproteobacteria bacterium]
MSNFETVQAITDNLQSVLKKEGIHFSRHSFESEKNIPASLLPLGQIFYLGESFENKFRERPSYIEAEYAIKVIFAERDPEDMIREQQKWAHKIRGALTAAAINTGPLEFSKYVSRVYIARFDAENNRNLSSLACKALIRYRES